jgi:hypothetical protein
VDELVDTFRQGLLALIPVAERAQIAWREPAAYDEWDELAECLYKVFVADSARPPPGTSVAAWPLPPYDYFIRSYAELSRVEFTPAGTVEALVFVGFATSERPFDTLKLVQVDPGSGVPGQDIRAPWSDRGFAVRRRFVDGNAEVVTQVRVDW